MKLALSILKEFINIPFIAALMAIIIIQYKITIAEESFLDEKEKRRDLIVQVENLKYELFKSKTSLVGEQRSSTKGNVLYNMCAKALAKCEASK